MVSFALIIDIQLELTIKIEYCNITVKFKFRNWHRKLSLHTPGATDFFYSSSFWTSFCQIWRKDKFARPSLFVREKAPVTNTVTEFGFLRVLHIFDRFYRLLAKFDVWLKILLHNFTEVFEHLCWLHRLFLQSSWPFSRRPERQAFMWN